MKRLVVLSMVFVTSVAVSPFAQGAQTGLLQVSVVDESGQALPDAPIYIQGSHPGRFFGGGKGNSAQFTLAPGDYTVSSALTRTLQGGLVDRLVSHSAQVHIEPKGEVSVLLTLHAVPDRMANAVYSKLRSDGFQSPSLR